MSASTQSVNSNSQRPSLWSVLVDLVAAKECGGCGAPPIPKTPLCKRCATILAAHPPQRVATARGLSTREALLPPIYAAALYDDPVRSMLIHYKERARTDLARPLAKVLATVVATAMAAPAVPANAALRSSLPTPANPLALLPMPSTRRAVRHRGNDTTAHLARAAAAELCRTGHPARTLPVLHHTRHIADQAGLDRAERAANLAGALTVPTRWHRHLKESPIVLIDDVATTGATLAEATRALRAAGGRVMCGAVVAGARFR